MRQLIELSHRHSSMSAGICVIYTAKMCREMKSHRNLFLGKCGGTIPPSALEFKTMLKNFILQSQAF